MIVVQGDITVEGGVIMGDVNVIPVYLIDENGDEFITEVTNYYFIDEQLQ